MEKEIYIETHGEEQGREIKYKYKGKLYIVPNVEIDFVDKLRACPAYIRVKIAALTEEEMLDYISESRKEANKMLVQLLEAKWFWRETGDPAEIWNGLIKGFPFTQEEMLKKSRSKKPFNFKDTMTLIDWFSGDKSDVYQKLPE